MRRLHSLPLFLLSLGLFACTGEIEDPEATASNTPNGSGASSASGGSGATAGEGSGAASSGGSGGEGGGEDPFTSPGTMDTACQDAPVAVGSSPLRRLTHTEYNNTVRDLLGTSAKPANEFADDTAIDGYTNSATVLSVNPQLAEQYSGAARELAVEAMKTPANLLPCSVDQGNATCAEQFIRDFGRRAFRRPVSEEEVKNYLALYETGKTDTGFGLGIRLVLEAMLQSPNFLFRVEYGTNAAGSTTTVPLSSHERASRLSYMLWQTLPDELLDTAADSGQLETPAQVEAQARRLLADEERAAPAIHDFVSQWLQLGHIAEVFKSPDVYPTFDEPLRDAMQQESERFVRHVFFKDDARLETLLTAPYSFVNPGLAKLYGVTHPSGTGFAQVQLDPSQRSGILTQASFLAGHGSENSSSPVLRGEAILTRLVCYDVPPPPPTVSNEIPELGEGASMRDRLKAHVADPACAQCHSKIDPMGLAFEHYDGIGRYRTTDGNSPVDATGAVTGLNGPDIPVNNALELASALVNTPEVQRCTPSHLFRYAFGRTATSDDACTAQRLLKAYQDSGGDLKEVLVAITVSDAFLHKRTAE